MVDAHLGVIGVWLAFVACLAGIATIAVGLVTPHGWIELPAPRGGLSAPDPLFWRKLQFVQDCWAANRGPMWIGPPPAPASPPAPSPPPPTSLP